MVTGCDNVIFGNNNKIFGDRNKVYGNNNTLVGNDNVVKGEQNNVSGSRNDVSTPFGSASNPSTPFESNTQPTSAPMSIPRATTPTNMPMNTATPPPISPRYQTTSPMNVPTATSPVNYPMSTSPMNYPVSTSPVNYSMMGFQPVQQVPVSQAIVPVMAMPQPSYGNYGNPFSQALVAPVPVSPFEAYKDIKKEKDKDILQDGTMVFMINEWESDYVVEFCQLVSMTCGQQVSWQVSCGRTCIVGMGDLEKIRRAIIDLLPQLNRRLKEWSWNTFGKNTCTDRDLFEKRLFKEYTREDVEVWRNKTNPQKAAA